MTLKERFEGSRDWIVNKPESLTILLLMGTGLGSLFFGILALASGLAQNWFFTALFIFFGYTTVTKFKKLIFAVKATDLKHALGGFTANEFVWHKNKYGRRIDVDGNDGCESDESCDQQDDEGNGKIGKEVRDIYRESE